MRNRLLFAFSLFPTLVFAANPALRTQLDRAGDFVMFGNTLAHNCAPETPAPLKGSVGACGTNVDDTAVDVFWRSDSPSPGTAFASTAVTASQARSTAALALPPGAQVLYARLYWAGQSSTGAADLSVSIARPGVFSSPITADDSWVLTKAGTGIPDGGPLVSWYQATADITALVKQHGVGAYRVAEVDSLAITNFASHDPFLSWSVVVFYELASEPRRNLTLFDGLTLVQAGAPASLSLSGFMVPDAGFDAKLGTLAYEGDRSLVGDSMVFNGTALSDPMNPTTNFFNGSKSVLGVPVSHPGDLPQLSGQPGSQSGLDLDIIDVTARVASGQTSATVQATTAGEAYLMGAFVTSIGTWNPDLSDTFKSFTDLNAGAIRPGDSIEYRITTTNTGNDTAVGTVLVDQLPAQVLYVPGSLRILSGPNTGPLTDAPGDDVGEYQPALRRVVVRLGTGANATQGGVLTPGAGSAIAFRITLPAGAKGEVSNQASISTHGQHGGPPGNYLSRDGKGGPTRFFIDDCEGALDCARLTPFCDVASEPNLCVECLADSDCGNPRPSCVAGACVSLSSDAGTADAGVATGDAGNADDAGSTDAGHDPTDGGTDLEDAGSEPLDAGPSVEGTDGGSNVGPEAEEADPESGAAFKTGCGCSAVDSSLGLGLATFLMAFARSRRNRARRTKQRVTGPGGSPENA